MIPRQDRVELVLLGCEERTKAANLSQPEHGYQYPTQQQRHALQQVGPDDRLETAVDGIRTGQQAEEPDRERAIDGKDLLDG